MKTPVPHLLDTLTDERPELTEVRGIVPSLREFGRNQCLFASRCSMADDTCLANRPPENEFDNEQRSACWHAEKV